MSADDGKELDARWPDEVTPATPDFGHRSKTTDQLDLDVCRATCERQRLALASLQAKNDELRAEVKASQADRRALAGRIRALEAQLRNPTK
jgi:hypothetical protein